MENLAKALEGLKLEDVKSSDPSAGSNLIEPTEAEIKSIVSALKDGQSHDAVKASVRRADGISKLGFSFEQIKEIDEARLAKVAELSPKEV